MFRRFEQTEKTQYALLVHEEGVELDEHLGKNFALFYKRGGQELSGMITNTMYLP